MIELPYYAFIEPLEFAMREVLLHAQALTGSWGFSLVLLSLAVNIVLLPLYHLAEGWQEAERAMQKRMAPKLAEIKEVFRGRERYMYVRALYRLHGYKPLYALRAAFGLLIQIPFFFAAYHLLNHMPALAGVSWLCFADLSRPDALLSLGGLAINILPFVMTAANLLSAAVYTSRLSGREKRNLLLLALLFLVLLYPSSTALLIYWTCNNIFSLGKNLFYARYVYADSAPRAGGEARRAPPRRALADIALGGASVLALAAALVLRKHTEAGFWLLLPLAAALLLTAAAARLRLAALTPHSEARYGISGRGLASFAAIAGGLTAVCVWMLVDINKVQEARGISFYLLFSLNVGAFTAWGMLRCAPLARLAGRARALLPEGQAGMLYTAAAFMLTMLVCWQTPMSIYASDPLFFFEPPVALVGRQIFSVIFFLILCGLIFHWANREARPLLALAWAWLALSALIFTFAAGGDYGHADGMALQKPWNLNSLLGYVIDPAVLAAAGALLWLALRKRGRGVKKLAVLMQGAAFALALVGVFQLAATREDQRVQLADADAALPEYNNELFGFSRQGKNTLILMTDMFTGSHLGKILEERPNFREELDGFTWYRDTISPGRTTMFSIAAILGGDDYAPLAIDARRPEKLIYEVNKGFAVLPEIYGQRGYSVSLAGVLGLDTELIAAACPRAVDNLLSVGDRFESSYAPFWRRKNNLAPPLESRHTPVLNAMGVFRAAPWLLRKSIYGDSAWMRTRAHVHNNWWEDMYAILDILPDISNAESTKSTVKYLAVNLTHSSWMLDESCRVAPNPALVPSEVSHSLEAHIISERCTLEAFFRWFDWMKRQGIYDNTQIIITSDHDGADSLIFKKGFAGIDVREGTFTADALLLVKQRAQRGALRIDDRPMSSSDVVPLICASDGPCPGLNYPDPLADTAAPRVRTHIHAATGLNFRSDNRFGVRTIYRVTGARENPDNWDITQVK